MNPKLLSLLLPVFAATTSLLPAQTVTVDLTQPRQTIHGFGAGMKRQTADLRNMTEPARTEVLNLMFADVDTRILRTYLRHKHELTNDNADPNVSPLD